MLPLQNSKEDPFVVFKTFCQTFYKNIRIIAIISAKIASPHIILFANLNPIINNINAIITVKIG